MTRAQYSVIRYIGDPARNEPLNVGIIVWNETGFALQIDEGAVARVIRENPHLERDALLYLDEYVRQRLARTVPPFTDDGFLRVIAEQSGFPVLLTTPRVTTIAEEGEPGIQSALDQLLGRIVRPARRRGGYGGLRTTTMLQRELKPLIDQGKVERLYTLQAKSGVPRTIDFFANSKSNVGLDVVNFSLAKADDVRDRADQEAFKAWDLLNSDSVNDYYVLGVFPPEPTMSQSTKTVASIITATGAQLARNVDEAREILEAAATIGTDPLF
jgi:hypothetical protein